MGAVGSAMLAKESETEKIFDFNIKDTDFSTLGFECNNCSNNCEIVCVLKEKKFIDGWNNRCPIDLEKAKNI